MLLQLSAKLGLNTNTVTSWLVEPASVTVWFSGGQYAKLDRNEGMMLLEYVAMSYPALKTEVIHRLLGIEETDEQDTE